MPDILSRIIATKHTEVAAAKTRRPLAELRALVADAPKARPMAAALRHSGTPRIIAECKRQSPSRGLLVENYVPETLALAYEAGGAAAISVLTDEAYFGGSLDHLSRVKAAVAIPVLRKDFIVDEYQIYEARAYGADSFLLLSGILGTADLARFIDLGRSLGMEPLIESHTEPEFTAALAAPGLIFGINNRDLKSFTVDLATAQALIALGQARTPQPIMVCESGIKGPADVQRMAGAGYRVFLVGEALATAADPAAAVRSLVQATLG